MALRHSHHRDAELDAEHKHQAKKRVTSIAKYFGLSCLISSAGSTELSSEVYSCEKVDDTASSASEALLMAAY